jgi:hypothetical protein
MNRKTEGRRVRSAVGVAQFAAVAFGFAVCTFGLTARGEAADPGSTITLRVANYARVPAGVLAAAQRKAGRALREAGIDTRWLECPLAGVSVDPEPRRGPADFFLTVVSKVTPERRSEQDALGFALPCRPGKAGCMAYILYSRIETLAADGDAGLSDILGHAMAHEIGHLLLGPGHSPVGIMRAEWNRKDLESAARNQLSFTPQQVGLLRGSVYSANRKPN